MITNQFTLLGRVGWKFERVEYDELRSEYVPVNR